MGRQRSHSGCVLVDMTLHAYIGQHLLYIHSLASSYGPALEHNGDFFACNHNVEPGYIHETHLPCNGGCTKDRFVR